MEPLTEENKKLREAMKLMEKNVQRAQRKRDLAESNTKDLEYQKGDPVRSVENHLCAAEGHVQAAERHLQVEKGYPQSVSLFCIIDQP